jgi:hypothetical protein
MPKRIDRRDAVRALGLAGLSLALVPAGYALKTGGSGSQSMAAWLRSMIADLQSARRVGQAYLATTPEEADRDRLLAQLYPRLEPGADRSAAAWRESYMARCRQDFAEGRTVRIDGWVLSQTEARLCALATLA